jgi:hypothetical protein
VPPSANNLIAGEPTQNRDRRPDEAGNFAPGDPAADLTLLNSAAGGHDLILRMTGDMP